MAGYGNPAHFEPITVNGKAAQRQDRWENQFDMTVLACNSVYK